MKRLYLLILRSFLGPFFLVFFIVLFVLLIQFLWRYIDELVGKGLDTKTISELLLYTSASLVPMALPLSILMSSLMTFGNLGERYELTAIKASGISLQRILRPMVFVVFLISICAFFFSNDVLPYSNLQMRSLMYDIRQQRPELQIKPGEFNNLIDGYSIRVNDKNPKTNTLYGVRIYNHSEGNGNTSVTLADSGTMMITASDKYLVFNLFNGKSYTEIIEKNKRKPRNDYSFPHRYDTFKEQQIVIELKGFGLERSDQNLFKSHYSMLNLQQLERMKDSLTDIIEEKHEQIYSSLLAGRYFKTRTNPKSFSHPSSNKITPNISQRKPTINTRLGNSMNKQNLRENIPEKKSIVPDTSKYTKQVIKQTIEQERTIDIDSLLESFTLQERIRTTETAIAQTRNAKNLIANSMQSLEFKTEQLRKYEIEWHRKLTLSIACILFMFIGAPLGAIIRKGGLGLPLIISVFFFILHYVLSLTGEKLVRESIVTDYQGMWGTPALFLIIGAFITYKATTDSAIFNMDTYTNYIKKLFGQKFNVVDKVYMKKHLPDESMQKTRSDKIFSSLIDLKDSVDRIIESTENKLRISDFVLSLYSNNNDSELILFERFYYNTFTAIINDPIFHHKLVRAKIYEFPALNIKEFEDSKLLRYILIIFACIPPLIIISIIRRYIKIIVLRAKLNQIKKLIPELGSLLKIADKSND